MGTLFSTLNIARSGLLASQVQLDIAGHNIANVNTEGFSRQRVDLITRTPITRPFGQIGRGVSVGNIDRVRDAFLDAVYREQVSGFTTAETRAEFFVLVEDAFLEPSENSLGSRLNVFFDSLNDFANNVEEIPIRQAVVAEGQAVAGALQETANRFFQLQSNANEQVRNIVPQINSLSQRVGELNQRIRQAELNDTSANDLRDDRDLLLDELANLVDITTVEHESGFIQVVVGGDVLVDQVGGRELEVVVNPLLSPDRQDLLDVRFVGTGVNLNVSEGELFGALDIRDNVIPDIDARLDTIAATLIEQINSIHSQGNGLAPQSGLIQSTNEVSASTDPLTAAGLPFSVSAGSFDLVVYDTGGTPTTFNVPVGPATTLDDLAASLDGITPGFSATVTGNTLELGNTPPPDLTYSFANDTSGVLTALGVNGFFTGSDARDIGVNPDLEDDPRLITSSFSTDLLATGDNEAALALAEVRNLLTLDSNSSTINDYYESTIALVGVESRTNLDNLEVERAFVQDFERRRQEVSGVSLDEEVTFLLQFQRAFEASARVMNTVDRMLDALFSIAV